jgi:hypothetical protein
MKKNILILWGAVVVSLFTGCSSAPVVLAPIGPNPAALQSNGGTGQLEVFSALSGRTEGSNPTWERHTDYYVCNPQGKRLEHVDNSNGKYSQSPRIIDLPPGQYLVEARAKGILHTRVPVMIKSGALTQVHLDGSWQPVADATPTELVFAPNSYPVGWSANSQNTNVMNH